MTRAGVDTQCHHPCVHDDMSRPKMSENKGKDFYHCACVLKWVKILKHPEFSIQRLNTISNKISFPVFQLTFYHTRVLFFVKSSKIQSFLHKGKKSQTYRRDNMHFSYSSNKRIKTTDSDFAFVQCQNIFS